VFVDFRLVILKVDLGLGLSENQSGQLFFFRIAQYPNSKSKMMSLQLVIHLKLSQSQETAKLLLNTLLVQLVDANNSGATVT
jgi:hypothetical protein